MRTKRVPEFLIALRCLLGPALVWLTATSAGAPWLIAVLLTAFLSDIFDGVIARRQGTVSAGLRVADSRADAWFFLCAVTSAWISASDVIRGYAVPILISLALQIGSYIYDLVRYGRISSLHAYSTKIWAVGLYLAVGALIVFRFGPLIWASFTLGIFSFADALAIKLILPGWRHDVLSWRHALLQRAIERV